MATQEQAFIEVMQNQLQYDFLKHKEIAESTAEEKKKVLDNINRRIARLTKVAKSKLKTTAMAIMLFIGVGLLMTSCDKQEQIMEQRELITQELTLKNIYTMPQTKGFDPTTWVFNYNTAPATLTFTNINNPAETVTRNVTIAELQAGISLSIYAGTYNITYETTHSNTTNVDIKINMPNTIINGTPIALQATYQDFLIIIDVPVEYARIVSDGGSTIETFNTIGDIKYLYYNKSSHTDTGLRVLYKKVSDTGDKYVAMNTFLLGHIYWLTSPIGAGTTITFPEWTVNKIVI